MTSYYVAEKFTSINGEGPRAGEAAVFIRFRGCNLRCSYCDTAWANTSDCPAEKMTAQEIARYVSETGIKNVTLTGGEPLLQSSLNELICLLIKNGNRVEIETNGSIDISDLASGEYRPAFTLDYKLPSSNMQKYMLTDNYRFLKKQDTVKFVCGSEKDLECARNIIEKYLLTEKCHVYFSPVFGRLTAESIVDFIIENKLNDVRVQLQLHKYIWDPDKRGV